MRVVATLSTLPQRYDKLYRTLLALNKQTVAFDAIYLTLPARSRRLKTVYPELPKKIQELCEVVHIQEDYGPVTKILGGILREDGPDTVICSFDDDFNYDSDFCRMIRHIAKNNTTEAFGRKGLLISHGKGFYDPKTLFQPMNYSAETLIVDILCGFGMVAYRRRFFDNIDELLKMAIVNDDILHNDDLVISGYLSKRGIKRRVYSYLPDVDMSKDDNFHIESLDMNALSADSQKFTLRFRNALNYLIEDGCFTYQAPVNSTTENHKYESLPIFGLTLIIFILLILVFALRKY